MRFEFDSEKNRRNLALHGIDFEEAQKLWLGTHIIIPAKDVRGEKRYAILGKIRARVFVAIYAERGERVRIISCHRADKKLERYLYEKIEETEKE